LIILLYHRKNIFDESYIFLPQIQLKLSNTSRVTYMNDEFNNIIFYLLLLWLSISSIIDLPVDEVPCRETRTRCDARIGYSPYKHGCHTTPVNQSSYSNFSFIPHTPRKGSHASDPAELETILPEFQGMFGVTKPGQVMRAAASQSAPVGAHYIYIYITNLLKGKKIEIINYFLI